MSSSKRTDLITGIALMLASIAIYVEAGKFPNYGGGIGSGGYPSFVAAGLFFLSATLIGQAAVEYLARRGIPEMKLPGLGRVTIYTGIILFYIWVMDHVGFIASSIAFVYVSIMFFGYRKGWVRGLAFSVALTVLSYLVFRHFFLVLLPTCRFF